MFRLFKRLNGYRCILNLGAVLMCIYIDVEYHKSSWYKENYDGGKKKEYATKALPFFIAIVHQL